MQLQADGTNYTGFRLRIRPVSNQLSIDNMSDPMPRGQNFHPIPVVLLSDFLRHSQRVLEHTVTAEQIVVAVRRGIHHQVSLKRKRPFVFSDGFAPKRNSRMHFARDQSTLKDQSEIPKRLLCQQISTGLRRVFLRIATNDDAIFYGKVFVRETYPTVQIFTVE